MNKGFTLIELLIVMVIVGTLVTIALPKYQNALERGRALEGIRNVQYVAEYVNAKHIACIASGLNQQIGEEDACNYDQLPLATMDQIKERFFGAPVISATGTVTATRNGDWGYSLTATLDTVNDTLYKIECSNTGEEDVCDELDLTGNLMTRK